MRAVLVLSLLAIFCVNDSLPARILGLFPHFGRSHQMVFEPLLQTLAKRGHHVTTVSFFPFKNPPENYTDVSLEGIITLRLGNLDVTTLEPPKSILHYFGLRKTVIKMNSFQGLDELAVKVCEKLVDWPQLKDALQQEYYDLIIMEQFLSDCMLGLLHVYGINAPIVGVSSCTISPWTYDRFGLTDNPSYVPNLATSFTATMNFWQRLENTLLQLYFKHWFRRNVQVKEQEVIEKYFGRKIPDLRELGRNLSLILVNTHHTLHGVRPLLPGVVEVSGMHLVPADKDIPPYIEKFINESEHGVVLLSFGSLIKTATLPKYKEEIIVNACAKLKQRVIWKYEDSGEEGTLTGNILRVRWLPQYELLQHPKVLAFVAHGGLLGMTEAVSAGKPMVVVPFFGDQPNNAAAAAAIGLARVITYEDLNEKDLSEAMQKVVSAEMRLKAKQVSQMWKDRIADPLETAVYWTERVIRWGHQDPLHSAARDMSFYETALLDIAAAVLLALVVLILIIKFLISLVFKFLGLGRKKEKIH